MTLKILDLPPQTLWVASQIPSDSFTISAHSSLISIVLLLKAHTCDPFQKHFAYSCRKQTYLEFISPWGGPWPMTDW